MSTPQAIADAISANLLADVTVANGAPVALAHAYTGKRKKYNWTKGPIAVVQMFRGAAHEVRFRVGTKKRIAYRPQILLLWVQPEKTDTTTDVVAEADDFASLIESVKVSLRKHVSLGGLVLKCAEDEIEVRTEHEEHPIGALDIAEIDFTVLDEINAVPTG